MANHQKLSTKTRTIPGAVILGSVVCLLVSLLLSVIITSLVQSQTLQETAITTASYLAMVVSVFVGTLTASAGKRDKPLITCGLTALAAYLCYILGGALVFGSGFQGLGTGAVMVLIGSGCVLLLKLIPKKRSRSHKIKYAFR